MLISYILPYLGRKGIRSILQLFYPKLHGLSKNKLNILSWKGKILKKSSSFLLNWVSKGAGENTC